MAPGKSSGCVLARLDICKDLLFDAKAFQGKMEQKEEAMDVGSLPLSILLPSTIVTKKGSELALDL